MEINKPLLQLARDFVANSKQENNSDDNTHIYTRMPSEFVAFESAAATDCCGKGHLGKQMLAPPSM